MKFPASEKIARLKNPLDWTPEKSALMVEACREFATFHYEHSSEIKFLYDRNGFHPDHLKTESDIAKIPSVGVTAMKFFLMTSLPAEKAVLKLTSSGTRGQKTQIWFDEESLSRVQSMLDVLWEQEGLSNNVPTNYVNFIYDPDEAKDLGVSFSVKNEQRFSPAKESYFAVRKNAAGQWEFRVDETLAKLKEFAAQPHPVRILGIPSFMFEVLTHLKQSPIQLPEGSSVMSGGGWKAAEDKSVTREVFRGMLSEYLGLNPDLIRDGYGMAEHSAPYMECRDHRFHIPVYNRIIIRDPVTMEALPPNTVGLMELVTPYNAMMPNLSILSTDLGKVENDPCKCGRNAPTFTVLGRAGLSKAKGCAITADDIVKRKHA